MGNALNLIEHLPPNIEDLKVLNLGAGYCASPISGQLVDLRFKELRNVEVWPGAYTKLVRLPFRAQCLENHLEDAVVYASRFEEPDEFDVILMIDFIEHLTKDVGEHLLNQCRIISKRVVLFVPIGHCPQDAYDGNEYQRHCSTWGLHDFEGANVEHYPAMHKHFSPPVDAAWVIYDKEEH